MAKTIVLSRKAVIGIVALSLLSGGGVAVANANGTWKDPIYHTVSEKYSVEKFCDGHNLLYVQTPGYEANSQQFQVIHNATECGGTN